MVTIRLKDENYQDSTGQAGDNEFHVGSGATGTLNISGGTINASRDFMVGAGEGGRDSIGTVNQSGGTISTFNSGGGSWFSVGQPASHPGSEQRGCRSPRRTPNRGAGTAHDF